MTKQTFLAQFERRMMEHACPARKARVKLEELALHHDFLKHSALKAGNPEFEAEAKASRELGNPIELADDAAVELRQASWWGRHSILGYIIFPILSFIPAL